MASRDSKWLHRLFCHPVTRGIILASVSGVLLGLGVWQLKQHWENSAPAGTVRDPSVVIGTFITLYGLFIAGFGGLVTFVAKRGGAGDRLETLRVMAIAFLVGASFLDLYRVLNSAGDLYTAAAKLGLSYRTVNDIVYDFQVYFAINVAVGAFCILVACLLARQETKTKQSPSGG